AAGWSKSPPVGLRAFRMLDAALSSSCWRGTGAGTESRGSVGSSRCTWNDRAGSTGSSKRRGVGLVWISSTRARSSSRRWRSTC
ncbi:hypothetical protein C0993_001819, partial [Termitomyces sp. T159_Od127]